MTVRRPPPHRAAAALLSATAFAGLAAIAACSGDPDAASDADAAAAVNAAGVPGGSAPRPSAAADPVPVPAAPGSGEPSLFTGEAGVFLTWLEPSAPGRHALRLSRWDGDGWSEPATVIDQDSLFVNWADFPALAALPDGTLAAHWLEKSGASTYAYDVRMALSSDGGRTWSDDVVPHRDGVQAEHGFVSLFPLGDSVGVVWLDGRATPDGDPMTLRFTTLAPDGGLGEEVLLDASTCDCCQTGVALAAAGPVVAYRDRTADEVRDIYVARRVDGAWSWGRPVHADGWTIAACPVNGPAIAASGERVAVAWFTAADGEPGAVRVSFSSDGGATFGPPIHADDGRPVGRVDLVLLESGDAVLSWVEASDDGAAIRLRRVNEHGAGPSASLATTSAARASGFPRMVPMGDRLLFAWTEPGEAAMVRTATAPVPDPVSGAGEAGR